ncbi:hypothetical protein [Streptacidiphilus rugosus]|uniref:hypothetical protein n=1 Tax=Streptacidiphilus rugosus TaxID=405783 RepID=UPI00055CBAED|nr:hypothetical protein [Streptacidiphilus rugosus]
MITVTLLVLLTPLFLLLMWLAIESRIHRKRRQLAKLTAVQTIESAIPAPAQAPSGEAVPNGG